VTGPATGGTIGPAAERPARDDVLDWVRVAARAAAGKASNEVGDETVVLDVGDVLAITHWFVITSGRNARQVKTIVDEVEQQLAEAGGPRPLRVEGLDGRQWVLMDYGDFVVHVFLTETRAYYELERLWADVPRVDWAGEG
jgi:ribosome-associated protein